MVVSPGVRHRGIRRFGHVYRIHDVSKGREVTHGRYRRALRSVSRHRFDGSKLLSLMAEGRLFVSFVFLAIMVVLAVIDYVVCRKR